MRTTSEMLLPSPFRSFSACKLLCFRCWRLHNRLAIRLFCDGVEQLDTFEGPIPREKLSISYSRSSGPGGQNVNKVNTKANVKFHVDSADWLTDRIKGRLKELFGTRINKAGELMISSQKYRTQHTNLNDAIARLEEMLKEASEVPQGPSQLTVARVKQLKRKAERKRLTDKKYHSGKKNDRSKSDF